MGIGTAFSRFAEMVAAAANPADLAEILSKVTTRLDCDYFALTHHVDLSDAPASTIWLHNYPPRWVSYFERNGLAASDPVHRASHRTAIAFTWHHVPQLIPLTQEDRRILALAADHGIGNGLTIPAHIPGEAHGSCSFATIAGRPLPPDKLAVAQLVGSFAFENARRIWRVRAPDLGASRLTDRQRDCLIFVARGKSDWETSRILDISEETVAQHIRQGCERYGVQKRTSLMVHALFDGTISFADIARR